MRNVRRIPSGTSTASAKKTFCLDLISEKTLRDTLWMHGSSSTKDPSKIRQDSLAALLVLQFKISTDEFNDIRRLAFKRAKGLTVSTERWPRRPDVLSDCLQPVQNCRDEDEALEQIIRNTETAEVSNPGGAQGGFHINPIPSLSNCDNNIDDKILGSTPPSSYLEGFNEETFSRTPTAIRRWEQATRQSHEENSIPDPQTQPQWAENCSAPRKTQIQGLPCPYLQQQEEISPSEIKEATCEESVLSGRDEVIRNCYGGLRKRRTGNNIRLGLSKRMKRE